MTSFDATAQLRELPPENERQLEIYGITNPQTGGLTLSPALVPNRAIRSRLEEHFVKIINLGANYETDDPLTADEKAALGKVLSAIWVHVVDPEIALWDAGGWHEIYSMLADQSATTDVVAEVAAAEIRKFGISGELLWAMRERKIDSENVIGALTERLPTAIERRYTVEVVYSAVLLSNTGRKVAGILKSYGSVANLSREQQLIVDLAIRQAEESGKIEFEDIEEIEFLH